jgi:prepilin-type N-terminal cleavage/methylation domain-containing protein
VIAMQHDGRPAQAGVFTRRRRRVSRRERGFSTIEVMVSIAISGVVLLGMTANTIAVSRAQSVSRNAAAATALAQQQLESLRNLPLDADGVDPGSYVDAGNPMTADGEPNGKFERTWVVSDVDSPAMGLKTITVTVAWTDYESHQTSVSAYVRCSTVPCT